MNRLSLLKTRSARHLAFATPFISAILIHSAIVVSVLLRTSYFAGDDFGHFYNALNSDFLSFVSQPIDIHFAPLHRACTFVLYHSVGMNYPVAVSFLVFLFLISIVYLHVTLNVLFPSIHNYWITLIYATNAYFIPLSMWWSSGIHRIPYVLFSIVTICHYLIYRSNHKVFHLTISLFGFILALGFFEKSLLLPVYILLIEICLWQGAGKRERSRNIITVLILIIIATTYIVARHGYLDRHSYGFDFDVSFFYNYTRLSFLILSQGLFAPLLLWRDVIDPIMFLIIWILLFIFSISKSKNSVTPWLAGCFVVLLNIVLILASPRASQFGLSNTKAYRYYFEITFLIAIFSRIILSNTNGSFSFAKDKKKINSTKYAIVCVVVLIYTTFSAFSSIEISKSKAYDRYRMTRSYVDALLKDIRSLKKPDSVELPILPGKIPKYILGLAPRNHQVAPYDRFLSLFDIKTKPSASAGYAYAISAEGRLIKIQKKAKMIR